MKKADTDIQELLRKSGSALQKAVEQRFGQATNLPDDFNDSVMKQITGENVTVRKRRTYPLAWISAASVALILITLALLPKENNKSTETANASTSSKTIRERGKQSFKIEKTKTQTKTEYKQQGIKKETEKEIDKIENDNQVDITTDDTEQDASQTEIVINENIYYASVESKDTVPYQAPNRMVEFIAKMAEYNNVRGEQVGCTSVQQDTTVVCTAYVFEDSEQLSLFNRLLQAACWYSDENPGYLLTYSRLQFFFRLEDMRLGRKYLWIAERIGKKILLFCTQSAIGTDVPSEYFREYRDKITNRSINQKT